MQKTRIYCTLIEDEETRERLLPELFESDLTEFFETCDIYSDSEELNSILVVSDETEHQNPIYHYLAQLRGTIRTDESLIKEDHSLKTFWNFALGKDYLNASWTSQLHQTKRIHIIYLAVAPSHQHHGLAEHLMKELIEHAEKNDLMLSLETHNPQNVPFYEHLGFKVYGVVENSHFDLKQYCMSRKYNLKS